MNGSPTQVRLLVMVLVGWCALSAAPVVANSPALPAAFFVIAVGLVAAVTLRFSTLVGLVMAVVGTALFAVSMVLDPSSAAARGGTQGVAGAFTRLDQLVPALVAAVSLVGVAVCASLASWEIEGRPGAIQEAARRAGAGEESEEPEQRPAAVPGFSGEAARSFAGSATEERPPAEIHEEPPAEAPEPEKPAAEEPEVQKPAAAAPGVEQEAAAHEPEPAAEEVPAAAGAPPLGGGPASAPDRPAGEQAPKAEEPAPSGEPPSAEEQPAEQPAATQAQVKRREGAAVAAPGESAPPAGEVKGEEIAARDVEEKNGWAEAEQPAAVRPDWRHRRRVDDDVGRRLPRRRKR